MKYVLLACVTDKPIHYEVAKKYGEKARIVQLNYSFITNYAEQSKEVAQNIVDNLAEFLKTEYDSNRDELYVLLVGGIFHNAVVTKFLAENSYKFKYLVYEKKVKGLVEIDADTFICSP